jgi:hypothetical protein
MSGRGRAILGQVVGVVAAPMLLFAGLSYLSAQWYAVDLSGVPDEGQVPPQLLPWFLFHYRLGGTVWTDSVRFLTWSSACLAYILPAALSSFFARRQVSAVCSTLVIAAVTAWAVLTIPAPPQRSEFVTYFTAGNVALARWWIIALTGGGAAAGVLGRVLVSRTFGRRRQSRE